MTIKKMTAPVASALMLLSIALITMALAFWSPFAGAAPGPLGWRDLSPPVKSRWVERYLSNYGDPGDVNVIQGNLGIVSAQVIPDVSVTAGVCAGTPPCSHLVQTASIATFPWPQKLFVDVADVSTDDTASCGSVILSGYDQFGNRKVETISIIAEAGEYSLTVFERLTRVEWDACGCTDANCTATDSARVTADNRHQGFRIPFLNENDFVAVCLLDEDDAPDGIGCASLNNATGSDVQSAMNVSKTCGPAGDERCFTLDLSTTNLFDAYSTALIDGPEAGDTFQAEWRKRY